MVNHQHQSGNWKRCATFRSPQKQRHGLFSNASLGRTPVSPPGSFLQYLASSHAMQSGLHLIKMADIWGHCQLGALTSAMFGEQDLMDESTQPPPASTSNSEARNLLLLQDYVRNVSQAQLMLEQTSALLQRTEIRCPRGSVGRASFLTTRTDCRWWFDSPLVRE